jgi:hypothetical protein
MLCRGLTRCDTRMVWRWKGGQWDIPEPVAVWLEAVVAGAAAIPPPRPWLKGAWRHTAPWDVADEPTTANERAQLVAGLSADRACGLLNPPSSGGAMRREVRPWRSAVPSPWGSASRRRLDPRSTVALWP